MKKITKMLAALAVVLGAKTISAQSCNAAFSYTPSGVGSFSFISTSTNTTANTSFYYDFGDNTGGSGPNTSHTYANNGWYVVSLQIVDSLNSCWDTYSDSVNVTGLVCTANSNFSLAQALDSLGQPIPGNWNVTPAFPYNVTAATWNWGDNTTSNSLYTSHNYANAGNYNICLSVTVSCGASSSSCGTYSISKMANSSQMVHVQVVAPNQTPTGITKQNNQIGTYNISPNPNNGAFNLNLSGLSANKTTIEVYNLLGAVVYKIDEDVVNGNLRKDINLEGTPNGIYFVKVLSGNQVYNKKIVITK